MRENQGGVGKEGESRGGGYKEGETRRESQ